MAWWGKDMAVKIVEKKIRKKSDRAYHREQSRSNFISFAKVPKKKLYRTKKKT